MIISPTPDKTTWRATTFIIILLVLILGTSLALFDIYKVQKNPEPQAQINTGNIETLEDPKPMPKDKETLSIVMVGDMMFDRAVRRKINNDGWDSVWGDTTAIFKPYDIRIGNLEGPITPSASRTLLPNGTTAKVLSFTFPTSTAAELKKVGFDAVSLANNHTDNFGNTGLAQTRDILDTVGVQHFGDPANERSLSAVVCAKNKPKLCVAYVGFHEFAYIKINEQKVVDEIKKRKSEGYYTIVYPHWGAEYKQNHTNYQETLAKSWIDAGADLVVGAHPHVVAHAQEYKGKMIFYSLGNYIFDQYFSFNTTHGLVLGIHLDFIRDKETGKMVVETPSSTQPTSRASFDLIPIANTGIVVKKVDPANPNPEIMREYKQVLSVFASSSPVWKRLQNK